MEPNDALKEADIVHAYGRVSTVKQEGSLPAQRASVEESLRNRGWKKKFIWKAEKGSGAKASRAEFQATVSEAVASKNKGKKVVVVIRDFQRASRDPYDIGYLYKYFPSHEESLWYNDIPLISLNEGFVTGTRNNPSPNADLIAPILVAAGGVELSIRKKQTAGGIKESKKKGIVAGTPMNLYYKDILNPIRELERLISLGVSQSEASRRIGRSKSWAKDTKNKLAEIRERGGDKLLNAFLDVTDLLREMEKENGPRFGKNATKRMKAVSRKTSGFLKFPWEYPAPTQADLDEYFSNFKLYLKERAD